MMRRKGAPPFTRKRCVFRPVLSLQLESRNCQTPCHGNFGGNPGIDAIHRSKIRLRIVITVRVTQLAGALQFYWSENGST